MTTLALLVFVSFLVGAVLIWYAIRRGREVDATIAHGRTLFKLKVK